MGIRYLNGTRLRHAIIAAAASIRKKQETLNQINVFPVPDGDTGTNMVVTMEYVVDSAQQSHSREIGVVSRELADSALMGARGNSGAILAQFFQGLSENLNDKIKVSTSEFGAAVKNAVQFAYDSMADPQEGTILTVIKDWAFKIEENSKRMPDFSDVLKDGLKSAKDSLAKTPEKLKVLAAAGVVDAGAQGFVHLLEGISHFIESGTIEMMIDREVERIETARHSVHQVTEIKFQYCTEVMIEGESLDRKSIRTAMKSMGDSLIVAGSRRRVRVHIHSNEPQKVFEKAEQFGRLSQHKIDDMKHQHDKNFGRVDTGKIALVVDSTCEIPEHYFETEPIRFVPIWVYFGDKGFVDKVTIQADEFYKKLTTDKHHPTTSQPSPADYVKVYRDLLGRYEKIICMSVDSKVSGTHQAAVNGAKLVDEKRITIIDSQTVSIGFGLIVLNAIDNLRDNFEYHAIIDNINDAIANLKFYIYIDTMTYLIRGGRVSKVRGLTAKLLKIRPVLSYTAGEIKAVGKVRSEKQGMEFIMNCLQQDLAGLSGSRFAITHTNAPQRAERFAGELRKRFNADPEYLLNTSPALGVHAGPGAIGVAVIAC